MAYGGFAKSAAALCKVPNEHKLVCKCPILAQHNIAVPFAASSSLLMSAVALCKVPNEHNWDTSVPVVFIGNLAHCL